MSNKTSDKNVANDSVIAHKFAVMQQQINEKDKRIQELEEENEVWDRKFCKLQDTYFKLSDNSIPKQAVINKIEEIKKDKDSKYYDKFLCERDIENVIEILQELLEGEK